MTLRIDGQYLARPATSSASADRLTAVLNSPRDTPRPAAGQQPTATTTSVQQKVKTAQTAQARADEAERSLKTSSDRRNIEYLVQIRQDAKDAWDDVKREVQQLYAPPAPATPKPPFAAANPPVASTTTPAPLPMLDITTWTGATPPTAGQTAVVAQVAKIDATTADLLALGSTHPQYQKIVMTAQADAAALARQELQAQTPGKAMPTAVKDALARTWAQETIGRAAASDTPLQTLNELWKETPQASGSAVPAAWQAELLCGGDDELKTAYVSGGVVQATAVLADRVEAAATPAQAAMLVTQSRALLMESGQWLAATAKRADSDSGSNVHRTSFDSTVANLARIYEKLSPSTTGETAAAKEVVVLATTSGIVGNVRAYDEALARAAMGGGQAQLTLDSLSYLRDCGSPERAALADHILNRCIDEFDKLKSAASKSQDKLSSLETEAQVYVAKAAPFADEAGIQKALQDFWADPKRMQVRADAQADVMLSLQAANALSAMATGPGAALGKADKALKHLDDFVVNPSIMRGIGSSEAAKSFIAEMQFSVNAAQPALFSPTQLERVVGQADDPDTVRDSWFELMRGVSFGQALSYKAVGDTQAAAAVYTRMLDYEPAFANGDESYSQAVEGMRLAASAQTASEATAAVEFLASTFNTSSNASQVTGGKPLASLGFSPSSAAALSVIGTSIDVVNLYRQPSFKQFLVTGVDMAQTVNNLQTAFSGLTSASPLKLATRGTWINGAGAVMSTVDFLGDRSGDPTVKALKFANAVGSWMVFASSASQAMAATGVGVAGAAIGLLATAALYQYGRVSASNAYETPAATAFIHTATGLDASGGRPIAYQLRNDDSHGVNHNEVIYLAVAQHLGIQADHSAGSKQQVVAFLNSLDNELVGELADTAAQMGFKEVTPGGSDDVDGNGQLYASTSENDHKQAPNTMSRAGVPTPESVNGLAMWIDRVVN